QLRGEPGGAVKGLPSDCIEAAAAGDQSGHGVVSGASASGRAGPVALSLQRTSWALSVLRSHGQSTQPRGLSSAALPGLAEVAGPSEPARSHVVGAPCGCAAAVSATRGVVAPLGVSACRVGRSCL